MELCDRASDSSSDEDERRTELRAREAQFRKLREQKKRKEEEDETMKIDGDGERVCQLDAPEDYEEYLGVRQALERRGWRVSRELVEGVLPQMQWCPYTRTAWPLVASSNLIANHYYMRSGLVRKSELHATLEPFEHGFCPEAHVTMVETQGDRAAFASQAGALARRGGLWVVKRGDSSNAKDMVIVGSDYSLSMSMNKGSAVDKWCEDAAARGEARVRDLMMGASEESKRPWMIQKYIERPLLIEQRKFHLRAMVLAVGRLKVYLHTQMIALTASRPYSTTNLEDLAAHASNHSVQERIGDVKASEGQDCLLKDLHHRVDSTPAIHKNACRLQGDKPDSIYVSGYGWHHTSSDPTGHRRDASFDPREFGSSWACDVWGEALRIVRVIFHAATHANDAAMEKKQARIFFPLPSCFEVFGVDLMLDLDGRVWLLEVNCDPDFNVFGDTHKAVAQRIVDDALSLAIDPVFPPKSESPESRPNGFRLAFEISEQGPSEKHSDKALSA